MRYTAIIEIEFSATDDDEASRRAWEMSKGGTNALEDVYDDGSGFVRNVRCAAMPEPYDDQDSEKLELLGDLRAPADDVTSQ